MREHVHNNISVSVRIFNGGTFQAASVRLLEQRWLPVRLLEQRWLPMTETRSAETHATWKINVKQIQTERANKQTGRCSSIDGCNMQRKDLSMLRDRWNFEP